MNMDRRCSWGFTCILIALVFGCERKPEPTQPSSISNDEPVAPLPSAFKSVGDDTFDIRLAKLGESLKKETKADITMTPSEFKDAVIKEYVWPKNEGKIYHIIGKADRIRPDNATGSTSAIVFEGEDEYQFLCLDPICWATAFPGQTITLRGRCERAGLMWFTVVNVKGEPPESIKVENLVRRLQADSAWNQKLEKRHLVLEGTIKNLETDKYKSTVITLTDVGAKPRIVATLMNESAEYAAKSKLLKVGQPIKLLGTWASFDNSLTYCSVLPAVE